MKVSLKRRELNFIIDLLFESNLEGIDYFKIETWQKLKDARDKDEARSRAKKKGRK